MNKYLIVKLEEPVINVYVQDEWFQHCSYLKVTIPVNKISSFDNLESIDEALEKKDKIEVYRIDNKTIFWGYCSNLQVWYENNYNTKLLHQDYAFPLLKKLCKAGAYIAKLVFKKEIAKRINGGCAVVTQYLLEKDYLEFLDNDEIRHLAPIILKTAQNVHGKGLILLIFKLMNSINKRCIYNADLSLLESISLQMLDLIEERINLEDQNGVIYSDMEINSREMFERFIISIENTKLVNKYFDSIDVLFVKFLDEIGDIKQPYARYDFAKLIKSIRDTPIIQIHLSRIENDFIALLNLCKTNYYEERQLNVSNKYFDFKDLIDSIKGKNFFDKNYKQIESSFHWFIKDIENLTSRGLLYLLLASSHTKLFKDQFLNLLNSIGKIKYPSFYHFFDVFSRFVKLSENEGLSHLYRDQISELFLNKLSLITKESSGFGTFCIMLV